MAQVKPTVTTTTSTATNGGTQQRSLARRNESPVPWSPFVLTEDERKVALEWERAGKTVGECLCLLVTQVRPSQ